MIRKITTAGNSAALVLSQDLLGLMGVEVGDEVDVTLMDQTLIVRASKKRRRDKAVATAIETVFATRGGLLKRLAQGDGPRTHREPRERKKG